MKNNKNKLNKIIFSKFVKTNFDFSVYKIKLKYLHSIKFADICLNLAKKPGLDQTLAYTIDLLQK